MNLTLEILQLTLESFIGNPLAQIVKNVVLVDGRRVIPSASLISTWDYIKIIHYLKKFTIDKTYYYLCWKLQQSRNLAVGYKKR